MKRCSASIAFALATLIAGGVGQAQSELPDLKGPYIGQEPPSLTPELFAPGIVSTESLEIEGVFAPGMKEFYFTRQVAGEGVNTHFIQYKDGVWHRSVLDPRTGEVFISTDGETMYLGNKYRERKASGWSEEKSLGPQYEEINTGTFTGHPYIAPDESYLIWDSNREGGYGDSDLYISFRQEDDSWGPAINMGEDINTEYEDAYGSVTPDGKFFVFHTIHLGEEFADSFANIFWVDAAVIEKLRRKQETQ